MQQAAAAAAPAPLPLEQLHAGYTRLLEDNFNGTFGSNGVAEGWKVLAWGGAAATFAEETVQHRGGSSQRFQRTAMGGDGADVHLVHDLSFSSPGYYRVVLWMKRDVTNESDREKAEDHPVEFSLTSTTSPVKFFGKVTAGVGSGWRKMELNARVDAAGAALLRVALRRLDKAVYIDNLTVYKLPDVDNPNGTAIPASPPSLPQPALLASSNFNEPAAALRGWNVNVLKPATYAVAPSTTAFEGGGSLSFKVSKAAGGDALLYYAFPFRAGRSYRVTLQVKVPSGTTATVVVRNDVSYSTVVRQEVTGNGAWQPVTLQFAYATFQPGSVRVTVNQSNQEVLIDDMKVVEVFKNDVAPANTRDRVPPTLFGMHYNRHSAHHVATKLGANIRRLWNTGSEWYQLQPAGFGLWETIDHPKDPGNLSTTAFTMLYQQARNAEMEGTKVLYTLGYSPPWATASGSNRTDAPRADAWREYVRKLKTDTRFANRIHYWELWNEADYRLFYTGTVAQMLDLAVIARQELGSAPIVSPGLTTETGYAWLEKFLDTPAPSDPRKRGRDLVDIIGFHFYYDPTQPELVAAPIQNLRDLLAREQVTKKIWNTEGGPNCDPLNTGTGGCLGDNPSADEHVSSAARALFVMWAKGIENFNYYFYEGLPYRSPLSALVSPDYKSLTPAGAAYKRVATEWLKGARFKQAYEVRDQPYDEHLVYVFELERENGTPAVVLWSTNSRKVKLPSAWSYTKATRLNGTTTGIVNRELTLGVVPVLLEN
ncbi:hypothetical protein OOT46_26815 [Aquabacterium sp. A7-Y]|uniref:hypothetical protein n=1 Tax=Aquabacterium sp. A7-Y TaxID=1349605 RepID=UPI00223D46A0|nr:hypothetical protein [Aquabacterium sp. A7-Y]MCW7541426.1 hypothetical protein [Aquabacterium sp. A7-Y]